MGIDIPADCRIETTIENHDWLSANTSGLRSLEGGDVPIICNVGGGNVGRAVYRIVSYAHRHEDIVQKDASASGGQAGKVASRNR